MDSFRISPKSGATLNMSTKKVHGATLLERILIASIRFGARLSSGWGYRGFGAACRIIQSVVPGRYLTFMLSQDAAFCVPFADGYWSMLIGGVETYEPEIEHFLKSIATDKYTFVDCGANYGYWSVLASSPKFGLQRVVAFEPSLDTFDVLQINSRLNGERFSCAKMAVGENSGVVQLSGRNHEARAVGAAAANASEMVDIVGLDELMDRGWFNFNEKLVIKLDVEGQEIAALKGSVRLLSRDSIVICEDHGSDRSHTISRHILESTPLKLYYYDAESNSFKIVSQLAALDGLKRFRNRGYNVFATASPFWKEKLETARHAASLRF